MKKGISGRKLNRNTNQRKQLFRSLVRSLALYGGIETSAARAKAVKPLFEKLITTAKSDTLTSLRRVTAATGDIGTAQLIMKLAQLFKKRPGGYTRLINTGYQAGNNAPLVRLELVARLVPTEIVAPPPAKVDLKTETKTVKTSQKLPAKPKPKKVLPAKKAK